MAFELVTPHLADARVPAALLARAPVLIRDEAASDIGAREALLDAAFGPARFLKTCQRLRDGRAPAHGLALVATDDDGALIGTLRLWPILAGGRAALLLGPLAVARESRSLGRRRRADRGVARARRCARPSRRAARRRRALLCALWLRASLHGAADDAGSGRARAFSGPGACRRRASWRTRARRPGGRAGNRLTARGVKPHQ